VDGTVSVDAFDEVVVAKFFAVSIGQRRVEDHLLLLSQPVARVFVVRVFDLGRGSQVHPHSRSFHRLACLCGQVDDFLDRKSDACVSIFGHAVLDDWDNEVLVGDLGVLKGQIGIVFETSVPLNVNIVVLFYVLGFFARDFHV